MSTNLNASSQTEPSKDDRERSVSPEPPVKKAKTTSDDPWELEQQRMVEFAKKCTGNWNSSCFPCPEKPVWIPKSKPDGYGYVMVAPTTPECPGCEMSFPGQRDHIGPRAEGFCLPEFE